MLMKAISKNILEDTLLDATYEVSYTEYVC